MDLATLIAIAKAATSVAPKVLAEIRGRQFSAEEREILVAAADRGTIYLLDASNMSNPNVLVVRVPQTSGGNKDFPENADSVDPYLIRKYYEAARSLCERGFVEYDTGIRFALTTAGFEKARAIKQENST